MTILFSANPAPLHSDPANPHLARNTQHPFNCQPSCSTQHSALPLAIFLLFLFHHSIPFSIISPFVTLPFVLLLPFPRPPLLPPLSPSHGRVPFLFPIPVELAPVKIRYEVWYEIGMTKMTFGMKYGMKLV